MCKWAHGVHTPVFQDTGLTAEKMRSNLGVDTIIYRHIFIYIYALQIPKQLLRTEAFEHKEKRRIDLKNMSTCVEVVNCANANTMDELNADFAQKMQV